MIKQIVEDAHQLGISKIVLGKLKGIRNNSHNGKANAMINNFWSFNYIVKRFKEKAEEYGIKVEKKASTERQANARSVTLKGREDTEAYSIVENVAWQ
jgi:IS605 OrfB family transposase